MQEFEDLDEIIARHIQPMAAFARDVLTFKYYSAAEGGKRDVLEQLIKEEKSKNPTKIPYFLSFSKEFPGLLFIDCRFRDLNNLEIKSLVYQS